MKKSTIVKNFDKLRVEEVSMDNIRINKFYFQPGWKSITNLKHIGYLISGILGIKKDSTTKIIRSEETYMIEAGCEIWVIGTIETIAIEFQNHIKN